MTGRVARAARRAMAPPDATAAGGAASRTRWVIVDRPATCARCTARLQLGARAQQRGRELLCEPCAAGMPAARMPFRA